MRKALTFSSIFLLFYLSSCDEPSGSLEIITLPDESSEGPRLDTTISQPDLHDHSKGFFNLDDLRSCGQEGITSFRMDTVSDPKNYLDDKLVDSLLGPLHIDGNKDWHIRVNDFEKLSCYQWEENEESFLFSVLQRDESCCITMYLVLTDKSGVPLQVRYFGITGADGGWMENDWVERIDFGVYKIGGHSEEMIDFIQTEDFIGDKHKIDEFEYEIRLEDGILLRDSIQSSSWDTLIPS